MKDQALAIPLNLTHLSLGLGWDTDLDLDSSILLLDSSGLVIDQVFYNQLSSEDGSVVHSGDNTTGEGSGDDETI